MKIICIGLNYQSDKTELKQNSDFVDTSFPIIYIKPDSAILHDDKHRFFIPDFSSNIQCEAELVIRIDKMGKNIAERFAHRYYNEMTIGLDLTANDLQAQLKVKGLPWELSKSFDNSAILGTFISKNKFNKEINNLDFSLKKNEQTIHTARTSEMIYSIDQIVAYVSRFFTLKTGDLIFTGVSGKENPVLIGDKFNGYLEDEKLLQVNIC